MDKQTVKNDYLESVQQSHQHIQQLTSGVDLIVQGGVEGIQEIARDAPELILASFAGLKLIIEQLEEEKLGLMEDWFEAIDKIEAIESE